MPKRTSSDEENPVPTPDPLGLRGRHAIIIGGSSGIGRGIALRFAELGAEVLVTGTRPSASDYEEHLANVAYRQLDVTDEDAVRRLADASSDTDVLVYSAGIAAYRRAEYEMAAFRRTLDVNLTGAMTAATCWHPSLARRGGSVVIVGSTSSFIATPGQPGYGASKGGLRTLVMSLACAWASDGVRVNGVAPGFVATKLTEATSRNEAALEASLRRIPLRRWGTPREMGDAAAFLASSMATYITGQMLLVDGGITLM